MIRILNREKGKKKKTDIYEKYRQILKMPDLTNKEIDEMRKSLILIAQTCSQIVWAMRFY